jgi:hypothetical protein
MTPESLARFVALSTIFPAPVNTLPQSLRSEQQSMLGMGGKPLTMELLVTVMQWYDTLSKREKESFWTRIVPSLMLPTPHGGR